MKFLNHFKKMFPIEIKISFEFRLNELQKSSRNEGWKDMAAMCHITNIHSGFEASLANPKLDMPRGKHKPGEPHHMDIRWRVSFQSPSTFQLEHLGYSCRKELVFLTKYHTKMFGLLSRTWILLISLALLATLAPTGLLLLLD